MHNSLTDFFADLTDTFVNIKIPNDYYSYTDKYTLDNDFLAFFLNQVNNMLRRMQSKNIHHIDNSNKKGKLND